MPRRSAFSIVEILIVILVIGIISSIGGSIGSQTMAMTRLRATAERLCADIKAQREISLARGSILPAGVSTGIHFFNNRLVNGVVQPGNSYVLFGMVRKREGFTTRPPQDAAPNPAADYAPHIVNLPLGTRITMGDPDNGSPLAPRARGMAFVMGYLDGLSVPQFRVIELSDDSLPGRLRITLSGMPPARCSNPVLTLETP